MKEILYLLSPVLLLTEMVFAQNQILTSQGLVLTAELKNLPEEFRIELMQLFPDEKSAENEEKQMKALVINDNKSRPAFGQKSKMGLQKEKSFEIIKSLNGQNSGYYLEKLDSIVGYQATLFPRYDSLIVQNTLQKIDINGYVTEIIVQGYDSLTNGLINTNKIENTFNAEGRVIQQLEYKWANGSWEVARKTSNGYNPEGRNLFSVSYIWDGNDWINLSKYEYKYDANGNVTSYISYKVSGNYEWIASIKVENEYHENDKQAASYYYNTWNETDSVWMSEGVTFYNDLGQRTSSSVKTYNMNTKEYEYLNKFEYNYPEDGSIVQTRYGWNSITKQFFQQSQIRYKIEQQFENDKLIQETKLNFINDSWHYEYKKVYEYDPWGNQVLYENYYPFWGDQGELKERIVRVFSEKGHIIRSEHYIFVFDEEDYYYKPKGIEFFEYELDPEGNPLSYCRYKWDEENDEWQVDFKDVYKYPSEGERTIEKYQFYVTEYYPEFERDYSTILTYDNSLGKYTGLIDDSGDYEIQFRYNEDRKISEALFMEDGEAYQVVKCYYDISGKDSLWVSGYYSSWIEDTVFYFIEFSYAEISSGEIEVTELHYDSLPDTLFDDFGNIIEISSDGLIKYVFKDEKIMSIARYTISGLVLIPQASTKFTYNNDGRIVTVLYESEYFKSKTEYIFSNDTLTVYEYTLYEELEEAWVLDYKTIYKIDPLIEKNQIQQIPAVLFEPDEGKSYYYEWYLQYDYGKILEILDDDGYYETGNLEIYYKSVLFYSKASALQGDVCINGYVFDGSGNEKSVLTTANISGNPVEGAIVSLCASADHFVLATDTTNADGFYEFIGVPLGNFYLQVILEGYEQKSTYNFEITENSSTYTNNNFIVLDGELVTNIEVPELKVKVWPNPAKSIVNIYGLEENDLIKIHSADGRLIQIVTSSGASESLDITGLKRGIYLLVIESGNHAVTGKIIKQ